MSPLVTLTTDFGTRDPYVATMKGVLSTIAPNCRILDLSHDISPQNILEGALFLAGALPYFPKGTIHVTVVDPGVGTDRRPIVVSAGEQLVVCPDNGIVTLFVREHPVVESRVITNRQFMNEEISPTFHGRDIFAPVAGHLAAGAQLAEAGDRIDAIALLDIPMPMQTEQGRISGQVMHVDRFGNVITNIHRSVIGAGPMHEVRTGEHHFTGVCEAYADVAPGKPCVLIGSSGYLEIAVNQGNAAEQLGLATSDTVAVDLGSK